MLRSVLIAIVTGLLSSPSPADGISRACRDIRAIVDYRHDGDYETACGGAAQALRFLAEKGLDTRLSLTIVVDAKLATGHMPRLIGQYSARSARIVVLPLPECEKLAAEQPVFGQQMSSELHRSFVAHEVAHAIAHYNFTFSSPAQAAQEYIAYVVQFATMPSGLRARILDQIPNAAFASDDEITNMFWALNPEVFAVKAYRHYLRPENGDDFLRRLLNGEVRPE